MSTKARSVSIAILYEKHNYSGGTVQRILSWVLMVDLDKDGELPGDRVILALAEEDMESEGRLLGKEWRPRIWSLNEFKISKEQQERSVE